MTACQRIKSLGRHRREHEKEADPQHQPENHTDAGDHLHHAVAELVHDPFVEFRFRRIGVDPGHFHRVGQRRHAEREHLDKIDAAAYQRDPTDLVFLPQRHDLFVIGEDLPGFVAHRHAHIVAGFHHHAFEQCLPADQPQPLVFVFLHFIYIDVLSDR